MQHVMAENGAFGSQDSGQKAAIGSHYRSPAYTDLAWRLQTIQKYRE